jgi:hypothetical protein
MRGVCRDCHRAGPAELAYQQAVRDIDRALRYSEFIPRRQRKLIEGFLAHADERTRAYAAHVIARDAAARQESARLRDEDERAYEAMVAKYEAEADSLPEADPCAARSDDDPALEEDLPF